MKRITLSMAALGVLTMLSTPATASDFSVFLRHMFGSPKYNGYNYAPPVGNPVMVPRNYPGYTNPIAPTINPVVQYSNPSVRYLTPAAQNRGEAQRQRYLQDFERRQNQRDLVHQASHQRPISPTAHDRLVNRLQNQANVDQRRLDTQERRHDRIYHNNVPNQCGTVAPRLDNQRYDNRGLNGPSFNVPNFNDPRLNDSRIDNSRQNNSRQIDPRLNQAPANIPPALPPTPNPRDYSQRQVPTYSANRIQTTFGY
jgi:hypothetical protein